MIVCLFVCLFFFFFQYGKDKNVTFHSDSFVDKIKCSKNGSKVMEMTGVIVI